MSFHNTGIIDNVDMRIVYFYIDFVIFTVWTKSRYGQFQHFKFSQLFSQKSWSDWVIFFFFVNNRSYAKAASIGPANNESSHFDPGLCQAFFFF